MNCWTHAHYIRCILIKLFIFNGRIIASQYWVGFCQTSTWISCGYTNVPSLLNIPHTSLPTPQTLGCYRALVWVPWAVFLETTLFYTNTIKIRERWYFTTNSNPIQLFIIVMFWRKRIQFTITHGLANVSLVRSGCNSS